MRDKADQGKPRYASTITWLRHALADVNEVMEFGAAKYEAEGYLTVSDGEQRYAEALLRHLIADMAGEREDQETGALHAAHAAACALIRLEIILRHGNKNNENRPEPV